MSQEVISSFGFSCPVGGQFYICAGNTTEFVGCCTSNPCTDATGGACPSTDLRVASFAKDKYEDLPRQDCAGGESGGALWYTCAFNAPPFMGCCAATGDNNPCATGAGCAREDLVPALLAPLGAADEARRTPLVEGLAVETTTGASSKETPSATASGKGVEGTLVAETDGKSHDGLSTGAIVGIVIGCCVVIVILVAILFYMFGRRRAAKQVEGAAAEGQPVMQYANAGQYTGDYQAVPSPYSDSYGGSTVAGGGRYSQESYAKGKSPRTPQFNTAYTDEATGPDGVATAAVGNGHRRYHSSNGLGLASVQELDSRALQGIEISAELDAAPAAGAGPTELGAEDAELRRPPQTHLGSPGQGYDAYQDSAPTYQTQDQQPPSHADYTQQQLYQQQYQHQQYQQQQQQYQPEEPTPMTATGHGPGHGYTPTPTTATMTSTGGRYGHDSVMTTASSTLEGNNPYHTGNISAMGSQRGTFRSSRSPPASPPQQEWRGTPSPAAGEVRPALRRVARRPLAEQRGEERRDEENSTPGPRQLGEPF